ncbi:MAG: Glu/Leu/Phe/Val dehydrogenase [Sinobacteraceae bacterium]|nr:Glu/Leu/Phe/Val dehydrogenase [Nevskiaceae bacterium]
MFTRPIAPLADAEFAAHEEIVVCYDPDAGLSALIAVHDTSLGPAAGGCRLYPYADAGAALHDVLRLSRAMSLKNALAGLPLGGGKSVIIARPQDKTPQLLRAFAARVTALQGRYWTAEDINIGPADADLLRDNCPYVFGLSAARGGSGDPSAYTAAGCFHGIRACLQYLHGNDDPAGLHVTIQGVGRVGYELARQLVQAGARLTITDVDAQRAAAVAAELGAERVGPADIHRVASDVFAPCAMGATINLHTIAELGAPIICGVANNQIADAAARAALLERGVLYAPDYVVNAGGMLHASTDIFGRRDPAEVDRRIRGIFDTTSEILSAAAQRKVSTEVVADELANARIAAARATRVAGR